MWNIIGKLRFFWKKCRDDNVSAFASQAAFFIVMSLIPFIMLLISLVQYTPVTAAMVMEMVNKVMPTYLSPFFISIIHEMYNRSVGIVSITAVAAIWSAAKGIQYLTNGLNTVYDIEETRNWLFLRLRAIFYTLILLLTIAASLTLVVFGNSLQKLLLKYLPFVSEMTGGIIRLRSIILLAVLIIFFAVLYKMLPNRKASIRGQLPGSIMSAIGWSVLSFGFSIYVDEFNGFSMYGSLTTIVLLMLWLYFGMYILLLSAEINNIYEDIWEEKKKWRD